MVPAELDLQDLCVGAAESEELDEMWTSLFVFILLFLLSVTYSASVTLFKVGHSPCSRAVGGPGSQQEGQPKLGQSPSHIFLAGEVGLGCHPAGEASDHPRLCEHCTAGSLGPEHELHRPHVPFSHI